MRPNIRVEIENNLVEKMEIEENEEGEISDHDHDDKAASEDDNLRLQNIEKPIHTNTITKPIFFSGINIPDKKEQEKLQERAKRFSLNPEEVKNFTDEDLQLLNISLGITSTNESNVRFEVIHMRGIDQMNAADILDYFLEFAPVSVEWIDEESCNVVWQDRMPATRALHFMSQPVRGMPVRDDTCYFDSNLNESEDVDQSILLLNKNREVQLQEEIDEGTNKLLNGTNSIDISAITATIPPGYWRLGNKYPKSKCLLLRFALRTDKKHFKFEHLGRYYKTWSKKNVKINMSESGSQDLQGIFGRNKEMLKSTSGGNPWSVLAKNWDEDAQFREKERNFDEESTLNIKNESLRVRLGAKRKNINNDEDEEVLEKTPMKKTKIPRMKMYADEEEEKIKKKKMLNRINKQLKKIDETPSTNSDLRTVLNMSTRTHGIKVEKSEPEVFDLGSKLKNRNRKMVFEIKREVQEEENRSRKLYHSKAYMDREREIDKSRSRKKHSSSDDEEQNYRRGDKPQSKVAVVIKTQKKPSVASAVASTAWSKPNIKSNDSNSGSASDTSESTNSSENEPQDSTADRKTQRPGFMRPSTAVTYSAYKNPLKIEISNDHFKKN